MALAAGIALTAVRCRSSTCRFLAVEELTVGPLASDHDFGLPPALLPRYAPEPVRPIPCCKNTCAAATAQLGKQRVVQNAYRQPVSARRHDTCT